MAGKVKYRHVNVTHGLKLYPAIMKFVDVSSLLQAKQTPGITVSYSPFGWVDQGGTAFLKGAPATRGVTEKEMEAASRVDALFDAVLGGLRRAKEISRKHTEKGIAIVNIRGRLKRMPLKAAMMMQEGKKKELVRGVTQLT